MKFGSFALLASLLLVCTVQAQSPPAAPPEQQGGREAVRKACAADIQSLCPDKSGREAMMCLRSNQDKAGAACKDALSKMPRPGAPGQ